MTLAATAKKLRVSFYKYIYDRVSCAYEMPYMADLIAEIKKHQWEEKFPGEPKQNLSPRSRH